jgi:hypothetical protein
MLLYINLGGDMGDIMGALNNSYFARRYERSSSGIHITPLFV